MGLFSIFRKPQVTANYMDSSEYIKAPQRGVLPSAEALPAAPPTVDRSAERSEALAGMLLDAGNASEETEGYPRAYIPLDDVASTVYSQILENDLPEEVRTLVQLNALYARDHEAWMRSLESDLDVLSSGSDSADFTSALTFRTEQLENRKRALSKSVLALESCGSEYTSCTQGLRAKITAIDKALNQEA